MTRKGESKESMAPQYSIVIPFYDGFPYVQQCVTSVLSQNFESFEILIVDDCDSKHSGDKLDDIYSGEPRIKIIHHAQNLGTLQTRRNGVLASGGKRVMFIDQDDTLAPGALAALEAELKHDPCDILHFASHVTAENPAAKQACEGMQGFLTPPARALFGADILNYQFAEIDGFDWQVTHKVYDGELARKAFSMLGDTQLTRADDVYASFVICSLAKSYRAIEDEWYNYHLGRGATLGTDYGMEEFKRWCDADALAYDAVRTFAQAHATDLGVGTNQHAADLEKCADDVRDQMAAHTMNELIDNLSTDARELAIQYACNLWPADVVAAELWRFVRDRAYALLDTESELEYNDALFTLLDYAKSVDSQIADETTERYRALYKQAFDYTIELERKINSAPVSKPTLIRQGCYEASPVRIFVTTHKDVATFQSDILQPVQVGPTHARQRLLWAYQDDLGDNIAEVNAMFCELATQYWAWKNVQAAYYGFCHYRRYFDFSDTERNAEHAEDAWGEIVGSRINAATQACYGLNDETIAAAIDGFDIITTTVKDVRTFPEKYESVYDHYKRAPYLKIEHLDSIISILEEKYPDYAQDARAYLQGYESCFCNMFIMRKEFFERYCSWLFPLLFSFTEQWDTSTLSKEALRTPGHLAERLLNIWIAHEKRISPDLRCKELPCVRFEHPEPYTTPVLPRISNEGKPAASASEASHDTGAPATNKPATSTAPVIPIVFAADNNYVPMLTTAIYSLIKNASPDYVYDIIVLESDISKAHKTEMQDFFSRFTNMTLRFARVDGMVDTYCLQTNNDHIGIETYYRFLTQQVLPDYDKVIYLDSDLIVLDDIAELMRTELQDNLVAAARDADYLGNLNMNDGIRMRYTKEVLRMKNPYDYFQAGVLVMNLEQMRKLYTFEQWLKLASEAKYLYDDQDILNACCEGRVVYLDNAWNAMNDCGGRIEKVCSFAPAAIYEQYLAAYENPKILHFAGFEKPWKLSGCDKDKVYWDYAKETPFYERQIISMLRENARETEARIAALKGATRAEIDVIWGDLTHEHVISEDNRLRKPLDYVLPVGSRRREVAKDIGRFFMGKK